MSSHTNVHTLFKCLDWKKIKWNVVLYCVRCICDTFHRKENVFKTNSLIKFYIILEKCKRVTRQRFTICVNFWDMSSVISHLKILIWNALLTIFQKKKKKQWKNANQEGKLNKVKYIVLPLFSFRFITFTLVV